MTHCRGPYSQAKRVIGTKADCSCLDFYILLVVGVCLQAMAKGAGVQYCGKWTRHKDSLVPGITYLSHKLKIKEDMEHHYGNNKRYRKWSSFTLPRQKQFIEPV